VTPNGTQPNILFIMSDEHAPHFTGFHGHPTVRTSHLDQLAARGTVFEQAYCNSPLCSPSRMSLMTGRYIHKIGAWDNSTPLPTDTITWAHLLRAARYDVVLSGKQHFVGPDQLHGFRAQLARDLHAERAHPTFDWSNGTLVAPQPWPGLAQAEPGQTVEIEVDDQAEAAALTYLRAPERREGPWALNVSFIAPHFPLIAPPEYWEQYREAPIDLPTLPPGHLTAQHPAIGRMRRMFGMPDEVPEELTRRGRVGYYGLIAYLDDKIGRLLAALEETGQRENTIVIYTSDHGEMAGEHGMWRKSNFYEQSARVPLVLAGPGIPVGQRIPAVVSLVDLIATLVDLGGGKPIIPLDGTSLLPPLHGAGEWRDEAFSEYLAHGVARPMAMLRSGRYKLNYYLDERPELYELEADPGEFTDLATSPEHAHVLDILRERLLARWNPIALEQQVRRSQRERLLIQAATLGTGASAAREHWIASGGTAQPGADPR